MRKQTNSGKRLDGKELILAEIDKRFKSETRRIRKHLTTAPSREKYIQLERDIIDRILHHPIDPRLDCVDDITRGVLVDGKAGQKTRYLRTSRFGWDIELIRAIRHNYNIYLTGNINYNNDTIKDSEKIQVNKAGMAIIDMLLGRKVSSRIDVNEMVEAEVWHYKKNVEPIIYAVLFYRLEEWLPRQLEKDMTNLYSLIKNTDKNREELDLILKECDEGLKSTEMTLMQYAALYLLIHTEYSHLFKPGIKFARLQRELDNYFGQNTSGYKPNKVTGAAIALMWKTQWINLAFPKCADDFKIN